MTPLSLSAPCHGHQTTPLECSIDSCLAQFTSAELLTGNNKFGCDTCTRHKYGKQQDGRCHHRHVETHCFCDCILLIDQCRILDQENMGFESGAVMSNPGQVCYRQWFMYKFRSSLIKCSAAGWAPEMMYD